MIDLNRSLHHRKLFSEFSGIIAQNKKVELITSFYQPYRLRVESAINSFILNGYDVIHISIHTFTPVWNGRERNIDIGFLYDPHRKTEKDFAKQWKCFLQQKSENLNVRFNYPYKGISDGFTKYLRTRFLQKNYAGIELEVNQKFTMKTELLKHIIKALSKSLTLTIDNFK